MCARPRKYKNPEESQAQKMLQDFVPETKNSKIKSQLEDNSLSDDELDAELDEMDNMSIEVLGQKIMLAKLKNLEERTASSREKSLAFRKQMFNNWSQKFTAAFEEAFSIVKNDLINLHLNAEQIATLNSSIENAIKKLERSIQSMCKNARLNDEDIEESTNEQ